jgi:hypothetical protein
MKAAKVLTPPDEPEFTASEIANHYRVGEATVRRWARDGMPSKRYNARLHRYKLSAVEAWLAARVAKKNEQPVEEVK